jgi:hypothetical protein
VGKFEHIAIAARAPRARVRTRAIGDEGPEALKSTGKRGSVTSCRQNSRLAFTLF